MGMMAYRPPVPFNGKRVYHYVAPNRRKLAWLKWLKEVKRFLFLCK